MNFFKQIFKIIRQIFIKKDKKIKEISTQEEKIIQNYNELYSQMEVGDIIWAKRYKNEIEKIKIPEGHREGPFIIVKKENNQLICIQGSGVIPYEIYYNSYFYLSNLGYSLSKETYFRLNKLEFLGDYSFIKMIDKLKSKDKERLFKQIKTNNNFYYNEKSESINLNLPIQIGDIIGKNSKKYIVLDVNDNTIICIPINSNLKYQKESQLTFSNFNNLDYSNCICFEVDESIKIVNVVDLKCIKIILSKWQEYINNCKNISVTQRGSVILIDNHYYYIYGEDGPCWLAFEINKEYIKNSQVISIGFGKFYTNYNDLTINKNAYFENVYLSTKEEKDKIKNMRKSYKENIKSKQKNDRYKHMHTDLVISDNNYIRKGDIIQINEYSEETFVVKDILGNMLTCVSSFETGSKNSKKHYFNKNNVIIVENKQKRK